MAEKIPLKVHLNGSDTDGIAEFAPTDTIPDGNIPSTVCRTNHSHAEGDITNLTADLAGKEPSIGTKNTAFNKNYGTTPTDVKINGTQAVGSVDAIARIDHVHPIDTSRAASTHSHAESEVTNLTADLAGKASSIHSHAESDITNLTTDLAGKEPSIGTKNTAFNKNYGTTPTDVKMNGTQGVGSVDAIARIDHIHPVDTSRAASTHSHAESDITNLTTDLTAKAPLNSPALITPNIGAATGTSLSVSGALTSSGGGIGYTSGAGGTVTQATSRTTGVTLSKLCGTITMFSSAVAAAASSIFTLTNTLIAANDILIVTHNGATNACSWKCEAICAAGSASIVVKNISAASITEATPLKFVLIKGVTA